MFQRYMSASDMEKLARIESALASPDSGRTAAAEQKPEDGGQRTEDRGQSSDVRGQAAAGSEPKSDVKGHTEIERLKKDETGETPGSEAAAA